MTEAEFFNSMDFLKLGRAISSENWQVAAMTIQRMTRNAKDSGVKDFDRQLSGMRQCINARQKTEAQNCLALMTAKRVMYLNRAKAELAKNTEQD